MCTLKTDILLYKKCENSAEFIFVFNLSHNKSYHVNTKFHANFNQVEHRLYISYRKGIF